MAVCDVQIKNAINILESTKDTLGGSYTIGSHHYIHRLSDSVVHKPVQTHIDETGVPVFASDGAIIVSSSSNHGEF